MASGIASGQPFSVALQPLARLSRLEYTGPCSEDRSIFAVRVVPSIYEHCQKPSANQVPKIPGQLELIWILELHPALTHLCLDNYIISSDYGGIFFHPSCIPPDSSPGPRRVLAVVRVDVARHGSDPILQPLLDPQELPPLLPK